MSLNTFIVAQRRATDEFLREPKNQTLVSVSLSVILVFMFLVAVMFKVLFFVDSASLHDSKTLPLPTQFPGIEHLYWPASSEDIPQVFGSDGVITHVTDRFAELFLEKPEVFIGRSIDSLPFISLPSGQFLSTKCGAIAVMFRLERNDSAGNNKFWIMLEDASN